MRKIEWKDKIALITGASSGIGADTARFLASRGIHVILVARRIEKLKEVNEDIKSNFGKSQFFQCDLTNLDEITFLIHNLVSKKITPDILINNAGIAWYGYFSTMPSQLISDIVNLNMLAPTILTRAFLPYMYEKGFGRIINIGSIAGKLPEQGIAVYSASKAYLDAFTKSLYREQQQPDVVISILRAGPIRTEFFDTARKQKNGSSLPAERFSVDVRLVTQSIWSLLKKPRRYVYVPWYMYFSPLLEYLFSGIIDRLGPLLLNKHNR